MARPPAHAPAVDTTNATPVASPQLPVVYFLGSRWPHARTSATVRARGISRPSIAPISRGTGVAPLLLCLVLGQSTTALADEPRHPSEPATLSDTAVDLLDVADAFDRKDPFDLNVRLAFDHEQRSASIKRESAGSAPGGYLNDDLDVAGYSESTERLIPELNIGLWRELALTIRMPIILAHNRGLRSGAPNPLATLGAPGIVVDSETGLPQVPGDAGALVPEQLFDPNFQSPTRSGIEHLAVGLDMGLMSQFRNPALPNWVIGLEGRFNVSEPMHACNAQPPAGQVSCSHPSDIRRDGVNDELGPGFDAPLNDGTNLANQKEGAFDGSRGPGVSRGTHALEGHAYVSRRLRYVEPYTGIAALAEFQTGGSDFGTPDLLGVLTNHPPLRGSVIAGAAVIPWEQPEKFSRISLDFRVTATYVSEGRDYSELFDPLGSSPAPSLRNPNFAGYQANDLPSGQPDPLAPSVVDPNSRRVSFTGITDVQQHGDYKLQTQFTWQAGRYVKFDLSGAWRIIQAHLITFDQPCNAAFLGTVEESGPCKLASGSTTDPSGATVPQWQSSGTPNPDYRPIINETGHRFRVDTSHGFSIWVRANVLF